MLSGRNVGQRHFLLMRLYDPTREPARRRISKVRLQPERDVIGVGYVQMLLQVPGLDFSRLYRFLTQRRGQLR